VKNVLGDLNVIARLAKQSFVTFCVSEIAETENIIPSKNSGLKENSLFQDRKV
jgi:hypothetical protein